MKYLHYKTDGTHEVIETDAPIGLEKLQELVGGSIEAYMTVDGASVYINEEGRLDDLPSNPFYTEDLRGDVVETGGVDEDGNDKGVPDDYKIRTIAGLPESMFKKGAKFTMFTIGENFPSTARAEIVMTGEKSGDKPVFKLRNKRKTFTWRTNTAEIMMFEGHDLPFTNDMNIKMEKASRIIRMNALYNLGGMDKDALREYIDTKQVNPYFICKDRINYVKSDDSEELLYPTWPASSQMVADLQSKQLKDGTFRIVV